MNYHILRDCATNSSKEREAKKNPYNGPSVCEQKNNCFYALQAHKEANPNESVGK